MKDLKDRITQQTILEGDAVYFDAVYGVAGIQYPVGTRQHPVNNETDLLVILTARNLDKVILRNTATVLQFTGALSDVIFIGEGEGGTLAPTVDFNGQAITCTFINLRITDTSGDNVVSPSEFWDCFILMVIAGGAEYHKCRFADAVNPPGGAINCYDCVFLANLINTTGSINIMGDLHIIGDLSNTTGSVLVNGNCWVGGSIHLEGTGVFTVLGDCKMGGGFYNIAATPVIIYGNCEIGGDFNNGGTGRINIYKRCLVGGASLFNGGIIESCIIEFTVPSVGITIFPGAGWLERIVSRGNISLAPSVAGHFALVDLCGGILTIDGLGGTVAVFGDCALVDLSGGAITVNDYRVPGHS